MNLNRSGEARITINQQKRERVEGADLTKELGLDRNEIRWRKSFTGFTEDDEQSLEELNDLVADVVPELADDLEAHISDHDETTVFLDRSTKSIEQLKRAHVSYFTSITGGTYGQAYFDQRARIGKIHDMLDLGPKVYLGAYSLYFDGIVDAIGEMATASVSDDTQDAAETAVAKTLRHVKSLFKAINLDQQVVMDTYIHSYSEQLENELRRQEEVAKEVAERVDGSLDSANQVTESTQRMQEISTEQAEAMQDVSTEVENMSATVEEIASTTDEVAATSQSAQTRATAGQETATDAIEVMESVSAASQEVVAEVDMLQERVNEIDEIVDVIDDIADQTNILALNASIEAARAGEAGEGFAVVAEEVKSLAEESQHQAGEIEQTVRSIQTETEQTVDHLDNMTAQLGRGIDQVEDVLEGLQAIVDEITDASTGIQEVSQAMDNQAATTVEISSMIDELVEGTEQAVDEIGKVAAENEELRYQIEGIDETVQKMNTMG